jgi:hypothetical protein
MPRVVAYCAKDILCLVLAHSHLLIRPRSLLVFLSSFALLGAHLSRIIKLCAVGQSFMLCADLIIASCAILWILC